MIGIERHRGTDWRGAIRELRSIRRARGRACAGRGLGKETRIEIGHVHAGAAHQVALDGKGADGGMQHLQGAAAVLGVDARARAAETIDAHERDDAKDAHDDQHFDQRETAG